VRRARELAGARAEALLAALQGRLARCWSLREFRMYGLPASEVRRPRAVQTCGRDAIDDLLLYRPFSANEMSTKEFLADAVQRLEEGQHVYTFAADGVLLHYSWLIERTGRAVSDFGHEFGLPGRRPSSGATTRGRTPGVAACRLDRSTAGCGTPPPQVARGWFIGVRAENWVSRHNIEKVGFPALGQRVGRVPAWPCEAMDHVRPDGRGPPGP